MALPEPSTLALSESYQKSQIKQRGRQIAKPL
jgi:hypothetical protein